MSRPSRIPYQTPEEIIAEYQLLFKKHIQRMDGERVRLEGELSVFTQHEREMSIKLAEFRDTERFMRDIPPSELVEPDDHITIHITKKAIETLEDQLSDNAIKSNEIFDKIAEIEDTITEYRAIVKKQLQCKRVIDTMKKIPQLKKMASHIAYPYSSVRNKNAPRFRVYVSRQKSYVFPFYQVKFHKHRTHLNFSGDYLQEKEEFENKIMEVVEDASWVQKPIQVPYWIYRKQKSQSADKLFATKLTSIKCHDDFGPIYFVTVRNLIHDSIIMNKE